MHDYQTTPCLSTPCMSTDAAWKRMPMGALAGDMFELRQRASSTVLLKHNTKTIQSGRASTLEDLAVPTMRSVS